MLQSSQKLLEMMKVKGILLQTTSFRGKGEQQKAKMWICQDFAHVKQLLLATSVSENLVVDGL